MINSLSKAGLNIQLCIHAQNLSDLSFIPKEGSLLVFGNGGSEFWKKATVPLDDYSKDLIIKFGNESLNEDLTNNFLYPHDSLTIPLQQLGRRLNLCAQSPLGIDIHPEYGLWFAFRAVVFSKQHLEEKLLPTFQSPCESCKEKDCLKGESFRKKRLACPIGAHHRYSDEQLDYHEKISSQLRI